MKLTRTSVVMALSAALTLASSAAALEPPDREQIEKYIRDGSFAARVAAAQRYGNHRIAEGLVERLGVSPGSGARQADRTAKSLPTTGDRNVFALLIAFSDYEPSNEAIEIRRRLFEDGPEEEFPYESLRDFYSRSSYGQLDIGGSALGWYTTAYPREEVEETTAGRDALIREAVSYFDEQGHDFSRYDNDGDGQIDYFLVFWAGPHGEWAEFWWGYKTTYRDVNYRVDGKSLGTYSWQWESRDYPGPFSARTAIHETGHALGLPDFYDYDDATGPRGGTGRLGMMGGSLGDHNCFSKFLLGWTTPLIINQGEVDVSVGAADLQPDAALLMHGIPQEGPYGEYFMTEYRRQQGNDLLIPDQGLVIWHVDSRLSEDGYFLYDNSFTDHKLLRLMEADGLEEIEQGERVNEGDFFRPGDIFDTESTPSSHRYDGAPTNLSIGAIAEVGTSMEYRADLGSGCALYCEASAPVTGWPGHASDFHGAADGSNCHGEIDFVWHFGEDLDVEGESASHAYDSQGKQGWRLDTQLGQATCEKAGEVLVCSDERCWQWRQAAAMGSDRFMHAAVVLGDGRLLVAGGGGAPEIFDPANGSWSPTGPIAGEFEFARGVLLDDGRVMVVGSTWGDPVSAEIYDPVADSWEVTESIGNRRTYHSLQKLSDGRVMAAGGYFWDTGGAYHSVLEVELFDPQTGSWEEVGSLSLQTSLPGLTSLADGRILVTEQVAAQIFDPSTETWSPTADLSYERHYQVAVGLADGRVLVAGGYYTRTAEIFDPSTETWSLTEPLNSFHLGAAGAVDSVGRVHLLGGFDRRLAVVDAAEVFDPESGSWIFVAPMSRARYGHGVSRLHDGALMVTGGTSTIETWPYPGSAEAEVFRSPELSALPRYPTRRLIPSGR